MNMKTKIPLVILRNLKLNINLFLCGQCFHLEHLVVYILENLNFFSFENFTIFNYYRTKTMSTCK